MYVRSYTGYGKTDIDSRMHTTEEELSFQEYLSIGDRNVLFKKCERANDMQEKTDIGGNITRHITTKVRWPT